MAFRPSKRETDTLFKILQALIVATHSQLKEAQEIMTAKQIEEFMTAKQIEEFNAQFEDMKSMFKQLQNEV